MKQSTQNNKLSLPLAIKNADNTLFRVGRKIEILGKINWPKSKLNTFIKNWEKGNEKLPVIKYPHFDLSKEKAALDPICHLKSNSHPLSWIIRETARSYMNSIKMLEGVGGKKFYYYSKKLYGSPYGSTSPADVLTLKTSRKLLKLSGKYDLNYINPHEDSCILASTAAKKIEKTAKRIFKDKKIKIKINNLITSKATAGVSNITLRESTCFSQNDIAQLIEHELLVHTLTLQNGRTQPLKTLGLNSPRATCSQEGLAVFAEFITGTVDISRLVRISSRVKAIELAANGADFIEIFKFFLGQGQSSTESFHSSARVFRGGDVKGRYVFTKDMVYLKGFIKVHQFFLNSLQEKKFIYPHILFSGRMDTDDVSKLASYYKREELLLPKYEPDWIRNRSTLLAFLLSSSVLNQLGLVKRTL